MALGILKVPSPTNPCAQRVLSSHTGPLLWFAWGTNICGIEICSGLNGTWLGSGLLASFGVLRPSEHLRFSREHFSLLLHFLYEDWLEADIVHKLEMCSGLQEVGLTVANISPSLVLLLFFKCRRPRGAFPPTQFHFRTPWWQVRMMNTAVTFWTSSALLHECTHV